MECCRTCEKQYAGANFINSGVVGSLICGKWELSGSSEFLFIYLGYERQSFLQRIPVKMRLLRGVLHVNNVEKLQRVDCRIAENVKQFL